MTDRQQGRGGGRSTGTSARRATSALWLLAFRRTVSPRSITAASQVRGERAYRVGVNGRTDIGDLTVKLLENFADAEIAAVGVNRLDCRVRLG